MKTILFELTHPKHVWQFSRVIKSVEQDFDVTVLARDKDVVIDLLEKQHIPFIVYNRERRGLLAKAYGLPSVMLAYIQQLLRHKPQVIVSKASPYAALLGSLVGAKTVAFPDAEGVFVNERFTIPCSDFVVTPASYQRNYGIGHYRVNGMFEEVYLGPGRFSADPNVRAELGVSPGESFFIVRFVGWSASHDIRETGLTNREKKSLIEKLTSYGQVFISSEERLPSEFKAYRFPLAAHKMHDALSEASLYVGDSQSMATEAGLLGTPSVRYNSFVESSDFSNLQLLEEKHELVYNYSEFREALAHVIKLAGDPNAKAVWERRRRNYFEGQSDIGSEIEEIIRYIATSGQ